MRVLFRVVTGSVDGWQRVSHFPTSSIAPGALKFYIPQILNNIKRWIDDNDQRNKNSG